MTSIFQPSILSKDLRRAALELVETQIVDIHDLCEVIRGIFASLQPAYPD